MASKEAQMTPPPQPPPESSRSKLTLWIPVLVALIAAVGAIVVALINRPAPASPAPGTPTVVTTPTTASTPTAATATPIACFSFSSTGGSSASVVPNAQASTHDVALVAASYTLNRQDQPPTIALAGQVTGRAPTGSHLWIVGNPDRRTRDSLGHPGSGRFYPSTELRPDAGGCWRNSQSIGYDEAIGITVTQLLVQVDDTADAEFRNRPLHPDGLSEDDLSRLGVDTIAFFAVPTAQ